MDPECDSAPMVSQLSVECLSCLMHQEHLENQPPPIEPCLSGAPAPASTPTPAPAPTPEEPVPEGSDGPPPACVASQFEGLICDQTTGDCDDMAVMALVCGTGGATLDTTACTADENADIEMGRSEMCACATEMGACGASTDCPPLLSAVMALDETCYYRFPRP